MNTDSFLLSCEWYADLAGQRDALQARLGQLDDEYCKLEIEDALETNRVELRILMWQILGPKKRPDGSFPK
jgi:hypothetical protein